VVFHTMTVVGGGQHSFVFDAQGFIAISTFVGCSTTMTPWFTILISGLNMTLRLVSFLPFISRPAGMELEPFLAREILFSLCAVAATLVTSMSQTRVLALSTSLFVQSRHEERRSAELLKRMLPRRIAVMLLRGYQRLPVDLHRGVALIFTDIVGFTRLGGLLTNAQLVHLLNALFEKFDALSETFEVFKVEVVGDAWLGACGLRGEHRGATATRNAVLMALRLVEAARSTKLPGGGGSVQIRVGVHCGNVVGALIGSHRVRYHLFGADTLIANRFESACVPNHVLVSGAVRDSLLTLAHLSEGPREFCFVPRGIVDCDRFGQVSAYLVSHCVIQAGSSDGGFVDCEEIP
jgi:class 3 adenylate cyclase